MEYAAALEEKANAQVERIIELEASVDDQTVLNKATDFVESAVTTGGANKDLKEIRPMMKQLTASVTAQAATLEALTTKINSGGGGSGKYTNRNKSRPGLHVCVHFKKEVYHKGGKCLELEANKAKRYGRCKSVLE